MSDLNRKLLWLTGIRMLVLLSVALPYILYYPDQWGQSALMQLIAIASVQSLFYISLLRILRNRPETHAYIQFFGDLLFITFLIHRLDAAHNFSTLYIIVITVASLFLRRTGVLIVAGLAYFLYASIALQWINLLIDWHAPLPELPGEAGEASRLSYNMIMHLVGFYGVAIMTAYLARNVERTEKRLRETHLDLSYLRGLYGDVIRSISSGLAIADLDGVILSLNESGAEILKLPQDELVGCHLSDSGLLTAEQWSRITGGAREVRVRGETECQRGDGEIIYIGFTLTELRDGEGTWHGYTLIFQDLTEWRQLQEQVKMQDRMAAIGQMAAGLAHEVGNPLAAILGSVEMLAGSMTGGSAQRKLLEITLKESRRLDRTVKAFLQFARPRDRHPTEFDVAALLTEDIQLLRNSEDVEPKHRIETDLEPAVIYADLDQTSQIFWNLARNALQAMPDGGLLTVTGRLLNGHYRMEFRDTGHGMSVEERTRLFHPFKSFFDSGTGLGMAIVYRIVAEHGGDIRVDSAPGQGSNIIVELPVRSSEDSTTPEEEVGREAAVIDRR